MASKRTHSSVAEADELESKQEYSRQPESSDEEERSIIKRDDREPEAPSQLAAGSFDELTIDPDAVQGTRFTGPLISGNPEDAAVGGIAVLHRRAKITVPQHGNFSVPIKFPPSTILMQWVIQLQQTYNGTLAKINLGNAQNGTDITSYDATVAPTQANGNFGVLGSNWTIWLSQVIGAGGTQGKATVLITYSVPAKTIRS